MNKKEMKVFFETAEKLYAQEYKKDGEPIMPYAWTQDHTGQEMFVILTPWKKYAEMIKKAAEKAVIYGGCDKCSKYFTQINITKEFTDAKT